MTKKLRLLLFADCNRSCAGCCNKDWDLEALPVCTSLDGWDEILLTGGEPLLNPNLVIKLSSLIPDTTKVILYTAKIDDTDLVIDMLQFIDGITITLHEQSDVEPFKQLLKALSIYNFIDKSLRLNVFEEVDLPTDLDLTGWILQDKMVWVKDCPLPHDEVFMKLGENQYA